MKSVWKISVLLVALQTIIHPAFSHKHHEESNIAEILAAGLIVKLLSQRGQHKHHHGQQSRNHPVYASSGHQPQHQEWGGHQESRLQPDFFAEHHPNVWAQSSMGYPQMQFHESMMEAHNFPFYYPSSPGIPRY